MENLVLILIISTTCFARQRIIKLELVQSSGSLDGLACAMSDPLNSSGGEFDTLTRTCTKLPKRWFSNSTLKPNRDYIKFVQLENIVSQGDLNDTIIPPVFVPGGTVILYIETTATPLSGTAMIDFVNLHFSRSVIQLFGDVAMHNKIASSIYTFNSFLNNGWGTEEHVINPFQSPNTSYVIEFHFTDSKVQVFVDGQPIHSYNHRTSLSVYQRLWIYEADNLVCKRLFFKY